MLIENEPHAGQISPEIHRVFTSSISQRLVNEKRYFALFCILFTSPSIIELVQLVNAYWPVLTSRLFGKAEYCTWKVIGWVYTWRHPGKQFLTIRINWLVLWSFSENALDIAVQKLWKYNIFNEFTVFFWRTKLVKNHRKSFVQVSYFMRCQTRTRLNLPEPRRRIYQILTIRIDQ